MNSNDALKLINSESLRGDSWVNSARVAAEVSKTGAWKDTHQSFSDWLSDAASRTKFNLNTFRRQMRII